MKILEILQKHRTSYLVIFSNFSILLLLLLGYLSIGSTLMIYGVESLIIGFFALLKFVFAKARMSLMAKILLTVFFIGHFGGFAFVQFFFIVSIGISDLFSSAVEVNTDPYLLLFPWMYGILISSGILFLSHSISFVQNYFIRGERNTISSESFLFSPYPRIVLMQLTIMIGGAISIFFNQSIVTFLVFLVLKTWFDLIAHSNERLKFSSTPVAPL